jgi:hypothetical protein
MTRRGRTSLPGGFVETTLIGGGSSGGSTPSTPLFTPTVPRDETFSSAPLAGEVTGTPTRTTGRGTPTFGELGSLSGFGRGGLGGTGSRALLELMAPFRTTPFGRTRDDTFTDRFWSDVTSVAQTRIVNGAFVTQAANGINNLRPEILSKVDFKPIWKPGQLNVSNVLVRDTSTIGDLINFGYQTKLLRQETLLALISNVKKIVSPDPFKDIKKDFEDELKKIETDLEFLNTVLTNIKTINSSLDIKSYNEALYSNTVTENGEPVTIPTLRNLFTTRMQFTNAQYTSSSETKILLQILFDLTNTLTNYSVNLTNIRDNDRAGVISPSAIDKTYDLAQNELTFNLKNFGANVENVIQIYDTLLRSLPDNPDSIIKLLTYSLAKENLVSKGLGTPSNATILNKFRPGAGRVVVRPEDLNTSDIFQQIVGPIGDTIFQKLVTEGNSNAANTLSSLLYVDTGDPRNVVLPFENRYVQADDNTITYVPGSSYFSDAIIIPDGRTWNIAPFVDYASRFNSVFTDVKSAINNLLSLSSFTRTGQDVTSGGTTSTVISAMSPNELNILFAEKFLNATKSYDTQDELNDFFEGDERNREKASEIREELERILPVLEAEKAITRSDFYRDVQDRIDHYITTFQDIQNKANTLFNPDRPQNLETGEQLLVASLFNLAGNSTYSNNALRKELFILTLMVGIYRNSQSRINFFQKLVETEFLTFGDILNISPNVEVSLFSETQRSIPLNPNIPGFNLGQMMAAFVSYYYKISASIIENTIDIRIAITSTRGEGPTTGDFLQRIRVIPVCDYSFYESYPRGEDGSQIVVETRQAFRSLMQRILFDNVIASNTIFNQIVQTVEDLYNSTQINGGYVHINPSNGKSLFNSINLSTQLLFTFETFIQYCMKYSSVEIYGVAELDTFVNLDNVINALNNAYIRGVGDIAFLAEDERNLSTNVQSYIKTISYLTVKLSQGKQESVTKAINAIKEANPIPVNQYIDTNGNKRLYQSLYDNYQKIADEFNNIRDMLGIFEVINSFIYSSALKVSNFFIQPNLQEFLGNSTINNIDFLRYPSQIRLANYLYQDIADKTTYAGAMVTLPAGEGVSATGSLNSMIVSDNIIPSEYNSMISMLSVPRGRIDTIPDITLSDDVINRNNKIITVGIPTGLTKVLSDKVSVSDFNIQGPVGKQADVIQVNIYPSDLRFAEITIKPLIYTFDLSLFVGKKNFFDLAAEPGESYFTLLNRMTVLDYEDPYNVQNLTLRSIQTDARYNFLRPLEINDIFVNTINSYLLGLYVNCLTGIKISEEVFISPSTKKLLNPKTITAIKTYLSKTGTPYNVTYTDTEAILLNANLDQSVKDTYRLMTYGSLVFNNKEATKLVNSSKIFDRVFHIPVNLRRLEIDVDATRTTLAGRMALERASLLEYITIEGTGGTDSEKTYLTTNSPNDFIIKDVFCAVSQIPSGIRRV